MSNSYEIDFHPVGDASRSGDAISAKISVGHQWEAVVIDGGTKVSGEALVQAIAKDYGTNVVNRVILTHPDDDHSSGLRVVLEQCDVHELWMHRPWLYAEELVSRFKHGWTVQGLAQELRKRFPIVAELEDIAIKKNISIYDPFAGAQIGIFTVLSPTKKFYLDLLPNMSRTPEPADHAKMEGLRTQSFAGILTGVKNAVLGVFESWGIETLDDGGETSASNESSVVLYGCLDDKKVFLASDAGQKALTNAADLCDVIGLPLRQFDIVSMPHHGSRRNIGPTLLNRIVGPILAQGSSSGTVAVASAAKDDQHHPKRVAMNAFRRRGCLTAKTEGKGIRIPYNVGPRLGYVPLPDIPIYSDVESP
ncbi:MBL fold metallo-hydrolase [Sulfitobacter sp. BDSS02]|nr:MBL fold metallo-hydrolase [Sulfitobacter sp. BDSS02]MBR9852571.1 MBL fold metallo-hydrolase [Paracoccaceae bacterium]